MAYSPELEEMLRSAVRAALETDDVRAALADTNLTPEDVTTVEVSHASFGSGVIEL